MRMKRTGETQEPSPKFPYATKPGSLRKFLTLIPQRPKPGKINARLLRSWGFKDGNDYSIVRVLKAVGLVGGDNTPTQTTSSSCTGKLAPNTWQKNYASFMVLFLSHPTARTKSPKIQSRISSTFILAAAV